MMNLKFAPEGSANLKTISLNGNRNLLKIQEEIVKTFTLKLLDGLH